MKKFYFLIATLAFLINSATATEITRPSSKLAKVVVIWSCGATLAFMYISDKLEIQIQQNLEENRELNQEMVESVPREQRKVLYVDPPGGCALTT